MKNSKYYVIGALVFLSVTFFFYSGGNSTETDGSGFAEVPEQKQSDLSMAKKSSVAKPLNEEKKIETTNEEISALKKALPDKQVVREEVEKDPHRTPESLLNFAKRSGPLMERALKDKAAANELISTLQDCALDETVAEAARALCVSNMEKIAKIHPEHAAKFKDLRKDMSGDVNKLLRKKELMKN